VTETGVSATTRNRTMTGLRFLYRVTLRRLDLLPEMYHVKEPQKVPLILNQDEARRLLAMTDTVRNRLLLSIGYGAGLRAGGSESSNGRSDTTGDPFRHLVAADP
jgi:integrase/recombinase XerD